MLPRRIVPALALALLATAAPAAAAPGDDPAAWEKECEAGSARACFGMAQAYASGQGVSADPAKAAAYKAKAAESSQKGCEAGDADSCNVQGYLAQEAGDSAGAHLLFAKACNLGSGGACRSVATAYKHGQGVKKDKQKTKEFFAKSFEFDSKACEANNAVACLNVGWLYLDGEGVKQDQKSAGKHMVKACGMGLARACQELERNPWLKTLAAKE